MLVSEVKKTAFFEKNHKKMHIFCKKVWRLKNFTYLCTRNTAMVDSSKG